MARAYYLLTLVLQLWDIRKSASSLGMLDSQDSIGVTGKMTGARSRERSKAHSGSVNGVTWTEDGHYLVTTGHDECVSPPIESIFALHWRYQRHHVASAALTD